jgi:hypothetical protein
MTRRQRNEPGILSPEYLVGLTDGEGCFYVNIRKPRTVGSDHHNVELHFYIKLKGDHLGLLKKVQKAFGCGAVYRQGDRRVNHSECYRFEVNSRKDINGVLIPLFDRHPLQGPKQKDYEVFKKIALIVSRNGHHSREGLAKIRQLKKQMNLGARRVWKIRSLGGNVK